MKSKTFTGALLAATALSMATPALAQDQAKADALAAEIAAMRAKIDSLEAEMEALKAEKPEEESATKVTWNGAPEFESDDGWSFKPRGRLQYDVGYVGVPDGIDDPGLGFSNELRRARLGVEGTIPGGFDYKFEMDFAEGEVEITDATLGYAASDAIGFTIGQHNNFQSLEELTSSRFTSFMERAAFTDAFNFERRVGLSVGYSNGPLIANLGVFTDNVHDLDDENNSIGADGRIVYAPKLGDTQLHLGGSAHFRDNKDLAERGDTIRYRQRPFIHSSDTRFLATPELGVTEETSYGLEAAAIHGALHAAGELHWLSADTIDPAVNPTFFGGYAELGYFLTGETRGYKSGKFDRTKVRNPLSDGGAGAFQVNLRYDYLDLVDDGVVGGKQRGYEASLIWIPEDHVRFLLNYAHIRYDDAAIPTVTGDRDYGVDVIGARAQVDF